jgi:branched-chain amino acid transport system ATP-binding protein
MIISGPRRKRNQAAGSLSGGQRQMVAMAKALMVDAKFCCLMNPQRACRQSIAVKFWHHQKIKGTGVPI